MFIVATPASAALFAATRPLAFGPLRQRQLRRRRFDRLCRPFLVGLGTRRERRPLVDLRRQFGVREFVAQVEATREYVELRLVGGAIPRLQGTKTGKRMREGNKKG